MPDRDTLPVTASYVRAELESLKVWVFEHFAGHDQVDVLAGRLDHLSKDVEHIPERYLDENDVRQIARQEYQGDSRQSSESGDRYMRIITVGIAIGTFVFVLRGGR